MADDGGRGCYEKLYALQKRLKGERLFIRQDRDIIKSLNENVNDTCKNVYHLAWATRQHWRNVERLLTGARVFPSECMQASLQIENVVFEDASKHLGYQDAKYGEFLCSLRTKPRLVALMLHCATQHGLDIGNLTKLLLCCLYGSCLLKEDENFVLTILKVLIEIQIMNADDAVGYFCNPKGSMTGFAVVLRLYSEMLFTSKLYLTAALHGAVMQVIVDDSMFLDIEMSTVLSRFRPKVIREKFGEPGTPKSNRRMFDYLEYLHSCLINLCHKFLKGLKDKIYCFPTGIRWILVELGTVIGRKTNDEQKTKALLGHVLMNFFICPAIVNPEPFGINSDAFVSEIARYNLIQVASILRSMALAELGMKDQKMQKLLATFEPGIIISFVEALLHGTDTANPLNEKEVVEGLHPNAALMTEKELKALVYFVKKANDERNIDLKANGIEELLDLLPPLPRRWTKKTNTQQRSATSLPISMQLKANPELMKPIPIPRGNKAKVKKPVSMYSPGGAELKPVFEADLTESEEHILSDREEYESILKDLQDLVEAEEKILVISFGIDSDDAPGTLSEEKVLGINDNIDQSAPVDSNDVEKERERRASSMIQDAMRDLEGLQLHPPTHEDHSLIESTSSSFFSEINSSVDFTPIGTPLANTEESKLVDFSPPPNTSANLTSNILVEFDGMETHDSSDILTPQRSVAAEQEQKLSLLDLSPIPKTPNQEAFVFEDQSHDPFFQNKSATLDVSRSKQPLDSDKKAASLDRKPLNTQNVNRASVASPGSLLGGLNTILQKPASSVSNSFGLNSQNPFEIEVLEEVKGEGNVEVAEEAILNEGEMEGSDSSNEKELSSSPIKGRQMEGDDSVFGDAEIVNFHQSESTGTAEANRNSPTKGLVPVADRNNEASKEVKKELVEMEKRQRKKTSSAWLMGKLTTGKEKVKSVKKRTKSDGQALRKGNANKYGRKMTQPQSELRIANEDETPTAASLELPAKTEIDVSEEILSKYRNITPMSAGLMEDDQNCDQNVSVKETEFDDDFKFEDAKRKLRIVLCMADRSNCPSGASSCFQLFMTFLQAQLAEAINLQDRSVVAQLHETLRSIRQLPSGNCEKLLDALQEDYKQRAPYIAYLSRSKQGLLASLSHMEQIRKKVERDKAICNKYFTAVCVRLFLETPEKKRQIAQFSQKFEETGMVDEKSALLGEFLEDIYKEMKSDPIWVSALPEQWIDAKVATERTIISKIYKAAFRPNGLQDTENDKVFHEHINRLSNIITVNHKSLQIPKVLQKEAPWPSAQTELLMINAYKTPADKLRCIHRCCIAIMNLLSMATPSHTSGADEFVPVLVYVLIRANPPHLLSTKQYINNFIDDQLTGEEMYCWTQFSAAVEFVKSLRY